MESGLEINISTDDHMCTVFKLHTIGISTLICNNGFSVSNYPTYDVYWQERQ